MLNILRRKPRPPQRVVEAREAIKQRGGLLKVLRSLVWLLATYIAGAVVNHYTDGALTRLLGPATDQFWILVHQPIGVIALLFVVVICAVLSSAILLAVWDSRPKKEPKARALTREERDEVLPLRHLWNLHGKGSVDRLGELFRHVQRVWKYESNYGGLLSPFLLDLERAAKEMTTAVADDTPLRADRIHEKFNGVYGAYRSAIFWLAKIVESQDFKYDLQTPDTEYERLAGLWAQAQKSFYGEIERVNEIPEHRGELKFGGGFLDESASRFLRRNQVNL